MVPFDVITWGDWKTCILNTLVLTTDTGHLRSYATDPYGSCYTEPRIMFPVENRDDRMHQKKSLLDFQDGIYKAYKQSDIESEIIINDSIGDEPVMLVSLYSENSRAFERTINGDVLDFEFVDGKIFDVQTNSQWDYDGITISGEFAGEHLNRCQLSQDFGLNGLHFILKL